MKVRCTLCPDNVWIEVEGVVEHLEGHVEVDEKFLRWPDGQLVVIDEDAMDEGVKGIVGE